MFNNRFQSGVINQPYSFTQPMTQETFFSKVMTFFGLSLIAAALGSWISWNWGPAVFSPALIAEFAFLLSVIFIRSSQELRALFFILFSTASGIVLVPLLRQAVAVGGPQILMNALGTTGVTFFGLSLYALRSGKDFSYLRGVLFAGLIGLFIAGFLQFFFSSPEFTMVYSVAGVLLFSGFVLYDMSRIQRRHADNQYIDAALALYLDFLNLFIFILQLFMGNGRRRGGGWS
jgi:FtsH-binding integral membrane protein